MNQRTFALAALLVLFLPALAFAASPAPAAPPAPGVDQFLASLQQDVSFDLTRLSPNAGAQPADSCGCFAQHTSCCHSCSGNNFCTGNPGCQTECSDELQSCLCVCRHTC